MGGKGNDILYGYGGDELVVNAYGGEDQVSVKNFFNGVGYRYVSFEFAGKTLDSSEAMAAVI